MGLRSIISKLTKLRNQKTTTRSAAAMETRRATIPKIPRLPENYGFLSTPEAKKVSEERNKTFIAQHNAFMANAQVTMDQIIQYNQDLAADNHRLEEENDNLRRQNGKLMLLMEMREEDEGEHLDGDHINEKLAKLL